MAFPFFSKGKIHIPAVIIAGTLCFLFARSGFLLIFFLIPLSYVCFRHGGDTSWAAFVFASVSNIIPALFGMAVQKVPASAVLPNAFFFTAMTFAFTWINAPRVISFPGVWRFIAGSALMTFVFLGIFSQRLGNEIIYEAVQEQISELNSIYKSASPDAAQRTVLDSLTPELMIEIVKTIMFRGGALVFAVFIFYMSREAGITLTRWTKSPYTPRLLKNFYADSRIIWFFSVSLVLLFVFRFLTAPPIEILLWNIFVLCGILYLAQGLGILQHFASRTAISPFLRLLLSVLFVLLLFSPGINAIFLGLVILLGIAENWVPIRQPRTQRPPSTPKA